MFAINYFASFNSTMKKKLSRVFIENNFKIIRNYKNVISKKGLLPNNRKNYLNLSY